jgi:filamentous hemagglutinin family protein
MSLRGAATFSLGLVLVSATPVLGQVTLDGSVGRARLSGKALVGPDYEIPASLGTPSGRNLFHSFRRFDIGSKETATFSGVDFDNVIVRVTGGRRSSIDGTLRSTIPGASLFLLNPAGVLFGAHAALDVKGSFHVSSAHALEFADGTALRTGLGGTSQFSAAPPVAFGFLRARTGPIGVHGSTLTLIKEQRMSVVGGDVEIRDAALFVRSGDIDLVSVSPSRDSGPVWIRIQDVITAPRAALGTLHISRSRLGAPPPDEPSLRGRAGTLTLVGGSLTIEDDSLLDARASAQEGGGEIRLAAAREAVVRTSTIRTDSEATAASGNVKITAEDLLLDQAKITAGAAGAGRSGAILLAGQTLALRGTTVETGSRGEGAGGRIVIEGGRTITIVDGVLSGETSGSGSGGRLEVTSPRIVVQGAAVITTTTQGPGDAGRIELLARPVAVQPPAGKGEGARAVEAAGKATRLSLRGREVVVSSEALPGAGGAAGSVAMEASTIVLDGARITATNRSPGDRQAGDITFSGDSLIVAGRALVSSGTAGRGAGGDIEAIVAGRLVVRDAAEIAANTEGRGVGGTVTLNAPRLAIRHASVSSSSRGAARAGDISMTGEATMTILGARVTAQAKEGNGGSVEIVGGTLGVRDSRITSEVRGGRGNGGTVALRADTFITVADSNVRAGAVQGDGGTIRVKGSTVLISADSTLNASSEVGVTGIVRVSGTTEISDTVAPLPEELFTAPALLPSRCAQVGIRRPSHFFVELGRGQTEPDRWLESHPEPTEAMPADRQVRRFAGRTVPGPRLACDRPARDVIAR